MITILLKSRLLTLVLLLSGTVAWTQSKTVAEKNSKSTIDKIIAEEAKSQIPVITAAQLQILQKKGEVVTVLDTRIKAAYDLGHIQEARFVGEELSVEKVWMLDRKAPVVVYGETNLSQIVGKQLEGKGFLNVNYLNGSLDDLSQEGIIIVGDIMKSDRKAAKHNRKNK